MKEKIHFRCGHIMEVELPKDGKPRRAMKHRMQLRGCHTCDYLAKVESASQQATNLGLAPLRGTKKQVDYALLLRSQQLNLYLRRIDLARRADPFSTWWKILFKRLLSTINDISDAAWWIEHQEMRPLQQLLGESWQEEQQEEINYE